MNCVDQSFRQSENYRQTQTTENVTAPHSWVVVIRCSCT